MHVTTGKMKRKCLKITIILTANKKNLTVF